MVTAVPEADLYRAAYEQARSGALTTGALTLEAYPIELSAGTRGAAGDLNPGTLSMFLGALSLDVGGVIKSRSGSSCGGVIANIDASTRTVVLCKK